MHLCSLLDRGRHIPCPACPCSFRNYRVCLGSLHQHKLCHIYQGISPTLGSSKLHLNMVSCSVPYRKHQFTWAESLFANFWRYSEVAAVVVGGWIFFLHKLDPVWRMGCCFLADHQETSSVLLQQCLLVASCAVSLKAAEKILEETAPGELEEGWKWGNVIFPNHDVLSPSHVSRIKFICHKIR